MCVYFGFRIGEISCPTMYFEEASPISFRRSVKYGFGVLATSLQFALCRFGLARFKIFNPKGRKLDLQVLRCCAKGHSEAATYRPKVDIGLVPSGRAATRALIHVFGVVGLWNKIGVHRGPQGFPIQDGLPVLVPCGPADLVHHIAGMASPQGFALLVLNGID